MLIISKHKWRIDGLNNITYDLISITRTQLFVKMNVHIDMKRVRKVTYIFTQSHGKAWKYYWTVLIQHSQFNTVPHEIRRFHQIIGTHYKKLR
jgi:hypothetical protein